MNKNFCLLFVSLIFFLPVINISMGYAIEKDNVCMHHAGLKALEPQSSEPRGVRLGWSCDLCELFVGVTSFPIGLCPRTMRDLGFV